jgi:hypothetical protein
MDRERGMDRERDINSQGKGYKTDRDRDKN